MTPREWETLRCEVDDDGVATLTLDRPEALNSFTVTMARELEEFFRTDATDDAVRAVVVTGAGRAFCAGMDLTADGNVFGLDESLRPHARGPARAPHRGAVRVGRARHRRQGHAGDPRAAQAGDRGDQRRRRRDRRHDDARHGHPARLHHGADRLRLRPARHRAGGRVDAGSCRASSGSSRRWSGCTPPTSSPPSRRSRDGWSARCTSPTSSSAPRRTSPAPSSYAARRSRSASPSGCSTATRPWTTRSRHTGPTASRCGTPASSTARRASRPSWRSATPSSAGRPRDIPDVF